MTQAEIAARREEIIRTHGSWTAYNLHLGHGIYTIGLGADAAAEQRVARIVRALENAAPKPLNQLRVLDLACYEGGFGIALAQRGAEVVGIEARGEHVAKARFAAEALGLDRITIEQGDVRALNPADHGRFDVVLCLGILYHLDAPDCFDLLQAVADTCETLAVIETQVGLSRRRRVKWRGREYAGRSYPENVCQPGAAADNSESFWPTRASLLNAVADVGFTSAAELLSPVVPALAAYRDHVTLLAWKGAADGAPERWRERSLPTAHPAQGPAWRVIDRVARVRGGGLRRAFVKRP